MVKRVLGLIACIDLVEPSKRFSVIDPKLVLAQMHGMQGNP